MVNKLLDVGPLELVTLGILNSEKNLSVSDIQLRLKKSGHDLAYTTVMTVLVRLYNKGMVTRHKEGRQFLYSVDLKKGSASMNVFAKVKNSLFGKEKLRPILSLLESEEELSREELEALKKAVEVRLKKKV